MTGRYMKKTILPLLALCAATLLAGCSGRMAKTLDPAEQPPMGVSFLPADGEFINRQGDPASLEDMLQLAAGADYVLIGEGHKNACDHRVQARLLEALAATDTPPSVGFEMVAVDRQPILDDFSAGMVPLDELDDELEWDSTWGYDFELYRPLFKIAQRYSLPVGALNMPKSVTGVISSSGMGGLNEDQRKQAPTLLIRQSAQQEDFLRQVFVLHDERDPENDEQVRSFFRVQSAWDSMMAEQAVRLRDRYDWPVVIIVGRGHVENGWGIERRLRILDPTSTIASFVPWRGGEFYSEEADAFFYCPARFKGRMGMVLEFRDRGVVVTAVERGSRADRAGLRPGDVLTEAQGEPVHSLMSLHMAGSAAHKAGDPLVFTIRRDDRLWKVDMGRLGVKGKGAGHPRSMPGKAMPEDSAPGDSMSDDAMPGNMKPGESRKDEANSGDASATGRAGGEESSMSEKQARPVSD